MGKMLSEQKEKKKLLYSGNLHLSDILENTNDSIWAINPSYEILFANEVFKAAFYINFGVNLKPGVNLLSSLPEPLRKAWKTRYDKALSNENFSFIDHVQFENTSLYIEVFMNPIINSGETIGALFFGKDITQRKQDEIALQKSQILLKSSLESQKDTILLSLNKDYEYLYFNSAHYNEMKRVYGKEVKIGMNILDFITSDQDKTVAKENYERAFKGESHSNIRLYGKDNFAYFESFFNPIINNKNEVIGATGLARNITERKNAELALLESEKKLRELNSTKDKLFSIIAHDLRSPFNTILGFSELLIKNNREDSTSKKYLNFINSSAKNTLVLLDNLLSWAKSQTRKINFNPVNIIFSNVIIETINLEKSIANAKNISINYLPVEQTEVFADQDMLKTILRNLISNAIKFTETGGQIQVFAITKNDYVEITVSDNGLGMNNENQKKLFKLTSSSSTLGTENEKGSGLGLVLCKDFVEKHNGKIWIESKEGKGSDFKFTLPLKIS